MEARRKTAPVTAENFMLAVEVCWEWVCLVSRCLGGVGDWRALSSDWGEMLAEMNARDGRHDGLYIACKARV